MRVRHKAAPVTYEILDEVRFGSLPSSTNNAGQAKVTYLGGQGQGASLPISVGPTRQYGTRQKEMLAIALRMGGLDSASARGLAWSVGVGSLFGGSADLLVNGVD